MDFSTEIGNEGAANEREFSRRADHVAPRSSNCSVRAFAVKPRPDLGAPLRLLEQLFRSCAVSANPPSALTKWCLKPSGRDWGNAD
jgi:hypothetical protein